MTGFFPNAVFGWCFYLTLVFFCWLAAMSDWKRLRIPNRLTLTIMASGLAANLFRSAWLGVNGEPGHFFGWTGIAGGLVEGFCFAAAGWGLAFAIFFLMWMLGTCGGGDVKLMAAVGAWVGPVWFLYVGLGTYVVVVLVLVGAWVWALVSRQRPKRMLSYGLPTLVSTVAVMLWLWRRELLVL